MNEKAQRIAIAKACGWRLVGVNVTKPTIYFSSSKLTGRSPKGYVQIIPDYLNDLNAMHEAEKALTKPQRLRYVCELVLVCEPHQQEVVFGLDADLGWWLAHATAATAAQRAKAFLRTLNLYESPGKS